MQIVLVRRKKGKRRETRRRRRRDGKKAMGRKEKVRGRQGTGESDRSRKPVTPVIPRLAAA